MLSVSEIARKLNVNEQTIRRMILKGEIIAYRFGRQFRIKESDYDKFVINSLIQNEKSDR